MGGSALLIYGSVADSLLEPQPAPRSMLDRLMGRVRTIAPAWSDMGDLRMVDLPTDRLEGLGPAFTQDVATRFKTPWAATASILEYFKLDITSVYMRGEAFRGKPPEWYVQLTFSGCAGMAEISAELTAHWAERWYRENQAALAATYFRPDGFEPAGRTERTGSGGVFVPVGVAGYALFNPTPRLDDDEDVESRYFEIDTAALETLNEAERATALRRLDEQLPPLLPTNACCCQLCAPLFDAAACDRVSPFQ